MSDAAKRITADVIDTLIAIHNRDQGDTGLRIMLESAFRIGRLAQRLSETLSQSICDESVPPPSQVVEAMEKLGRAQTSYALKVLAAVDGRTKGPVN